LLLASHELVHPLLVLEHLKCFIMQSGNLKEVIRPRRLLILALSLGLIHADVHLAQFTLIVSYGHSIGIGVV
jgi:hypothetical protein